VTLILSTAEAGVVGNTTINDFTLVPGNNTLPMTGIINQTLITQSLNKTGFVTLSIMGQSAIYNGQHLTYYVRTVHLSLISNNTNARTGETTGKQHSFTGYERGASFARQHLSFRTELMMA
jgi:hypothetical protein